MWFFNKAIVFPLLSTIENVSVNILCAINPHGQATAFGSKTVTPSNAIVLPNYSLVTKGEQKELASAIVISLPANYLLDLLFTYLR